MKNNIEMLKKFMGLLWMLIAPVTIALLVIGAFKNISATGTGDINKPLPWIIIISIFTPVAIGLMIFGWYAWKGEYDPSKDSTTET